MRKNYDFSKGQKNPYIKKIKAQGYKIEPEISLELKDARTGIERDDFHRFTGAMV